jgi:hypothetical protein
MRHKADITRCRYVFEDGSRCQTVSKNPEWNGLCEKHFKMINKDLDGARIDEDLVNLKKTMKEAMKSDNLAAFFKQMRDELAPSDFDAAKELVILKSRGDMDEATMAVEKYVFVLWLSADPYLRQPAKQKDLAYLLGVAESTLDVWRRQPAIINLIEEHSERWMRSHRRIVNIALLGRCLNGDVAAMKLYNEMYPMRVERGERKELPSSLPKILTKEAVEVPEQGHGAGIRKDGVSRKLVEELSHKLAGSEPRQ